MDRSAQNSECEFMNLRRLKFVFDVSPLEIIDNNKEEDFIHGGAAAGAAAGAVGRRNMNQINLVIHAISHDIIYQYWSLKTDQQLNLSSSSCHEQHHRDHHHVRDDDDGEMIMIACQPSASPLKAADILLEGGGVFASYEDHQKVIKEDVNKDDHVADDYIMSQLRDVDLLYEMEWIHKQEQLEEVKRCIIQRISEAKPAVLLAKLKTVRIRVDLSSILKKYYANPAAAASAKTEKERYFNSTVDEDVFYFHAPTLYDDVRMMMMAIMMKKPAALKSSQEALETKILEEEDLISSSSSSSCSVCSKEFRVGVDEIKKMPCSHVFHSTCLNNWLFSDNTCPICSHELPTLQSRFLEANCHMHANVQM